MWDPDVRRRMLEESKTIKRHRDEIMKDRSSWLNPDYEPIC